MMSAAPMLASAFQGKGVFAIPQILGGMMGNSGAPYEAAMNQYGDFTKRAEGTQNPFLQAGQGAIPNYQNFLNRMQNPSEFINNLMGQYRESPFAHIQQQQAMRAAQNAASAAGLSGSTPLMSQMQQNASNISSQDMNQWLQNVLGINTQYGTGQQNLMSQGANAANALTSFYGNMAGPMGEAAYGQRYGQNMDRSNILGGILGLFGI